MQLSKPIVSNGAPGLEHRLPLNRSNVMLVLRKEDHAKRGGKGKGSRNTTGVNSKFILRVVVLEEELKPIRDSASTEHCHYTLPCHLISRRRKGMYNSAVTAKATSNPMSPVYFAIGPTNHT